MLLRDPQALIGASLLLRMAQPWAFWSLRNASWTQSLPIVYM